jgi:hypothetical protein
LETSAKAIRIANLDGEVDWRLAGERDIERNIAVISLASIISMHFLQQPLRVSVQSRKCRQLVRIRIDRTFTYHRFI